MQTQFCFWFESYKNNWEFRLEFSITLNKKIKQCASNTILLVGK